MVRTDMINHIIEREGRKISHLAKRIGIDQRSLGRKLKSGNFTAEEFLGLMFQLNIYGDRIYNYIEVSGLGRGKA